MLDCVKSFIESPSVDHPLIDSKEVKGKLNLFVVHKVCNREAGYSLRKERSKASKVIKLKVSKEEFEIFKLYARHMQRTLRHWSLYSDRKY